MNSLAQILADGIPGWVIPLVVLLIWAINATVGLSKTQKKRTTSRPSDQGAVLERGAMNAPPGRTPQDRHRRHVEQQQKKQMQKKQLPAKKPPVRPPPPPIPVQVAADATTASAIESRVKIDSPFDQPRRAVSPTVRATAATVGRWMTPQTLRHQWILTEVLGKPVSMRSEIDRIGG